jgi:tripartite-type tricarboxylate transporter receptor subunit TctC
MHMRSITWWSAAAAVVLSSTSIVPAAAAEVSFKGKRLELIIASDPGGGTDRVGRLVAQHMEKYLPGKPTIVMKNMGAGGGKIRAANYLMTRAAPNGLTFMQSDTTIVQPSTLTRKSARFDPKKFAIIGSINRGGSILFIRKDAVKRLKDKAQRPVIVAAISGTRSWQAMPMWGAEVFGWNLRWIPGYKGSGQMTAAIRRGEIDVFATNNAYIIDELVRDNVVDLLVQEGQREKGKFVPRPSYPKVPSMAAMLLDAKIPKVAWQGFQSITAPSQIDKWMALPPKTPADIVKAYRTAYGKAVSDPAFLKVAKKQISAEIYYLPGEEVEAMIKEVHDVPKAALDYAEDMKRKYGLSSFKKKKKKKE